MSSSSGPQGTKMDVKPLWKQPAALQSVLAVLRVLQVLCAFAILVPAGMSADAARKAQSATTLVTSVLSSLGLTRASTSSPSTSSSSTLGSLGVAPSPSSSLTALGAVASDASSPSSSPSSTEYSSSPSSSSTMYSSSPSQAPHSASTSPSSATSSSSTTTGLGISSSPDLSFDPKDPLGLGIAVDPTGTAYSSDLPSFPTSGSSSTGSSGSSFTGGFGNGFTGMFGSGFGGFSSGGFGGSSGPLSALSQSSQNMMSSAASNIDKLGHRRQLLTGGGMDPQGAVGLYVIVLLLGLFTLALSVVWLVITFKPSRRASCLGARCCCGKSFLFELIADGLLMITWLALTIAAGVVGLLSYEVTMAALAAVLVVLLGLSFAARLLLVLAAPAAADVDGGEVIPSSPSVSPVAAVVTEAPQKQVVAEGV